VNVEAQVAASKIAQAKTPAMSDLEAARRIAFVLERGRRELLQQKGEASVNDAD
jgi:predicted protein tyrosine phosphatase